jgi:uncharacterized membrane protein
MKPSRRDQPRPVLAHRRAALTVVLAVALTGLLPGCGLWSSQSSDEAVGQQLAALRKAYDSGAITREEYERERRRIIGDW